MLCRLAEHFGYVAMLPRPITTLTALFTMISHSVSKSKKIINAHEFWFYRVGGLWSHGREETLPCILWEADARNSVGNFLVHFCSKSSLQKTLGRGEARPPISLIIATQTLSCAPHRKDLHNLLLRVTMRQTETQKRFPSWAGETSPI